VKLLVDVNLSPEKVLVEAGIEAAHWSTVGAATAPDAEIMAFARANDYVVLPHDLDFSAILATTHVNKPSVAQIQSDDVSPKAIGRHVINALRQMKFELEQGALLTIDPKRTRLRLLPLQER
jgi:predicted nuclease of predicted toxin-antitoxin system